MLIIKKQPKPKQDFAPPANVIKLDKKLQKRFERIARVVNENKETWLPDMAEGFVRDLLISSEPRELVEFGLIHDQMYLYRILHEFVRLKLRCVDQPNELLAHFAEVAAMFLTQAYCRWHDPNDWRHANNRWACHLCLELMKLLRPFEVPLKDTAPTATSTGGNP